MRFEDFARRCRGLASKARTAVRAPRRTVRSAVRGLRQRVVRSRRRRAHQLETKARQDLASGRHRTALRRFRRSLRLNPERDKVRHRYREATRVAALDAIRSGRLATAARILGRHGGDDDKLQALGTWNARLIAAAPGRPPSIPCVGIADPADVIVVIERGVDHEALPIFLTAFRDSEIRSLDGVTLGLGDGARPILSLAQEAPLSFEQDAEFVREISRHTERLVERIVAEAPPELTHRQGVNIPRLMTYELEDLVFASGKSLQGLRHLLETRSARPIVLVLGDGKLKQSIAPLLAERDAPCFAAWCSASLGRYDASYHEVETPEARPSPLHAAEHSLPLPPDEDGSGNGSEVQDPRAGSQEPVRPRSARQRDHLVCSLLAAPDPRHSSSLATIARALEPDVQVDVLPLLEGPKGATAYDPFRQLAGERPGTRMVNAVSSQRTDLSVPGPRPSDRVIASLEERGALGGARAGGAVLEPITLPRLRLAIDRRLPLFADFADRFARYLDEHDPDVILVSPDRTPRARIACELARRAGIPTLVPQIVLLSPSPRYKPIQADVTCVLDQYHRDLFLDRGWADDDHVFVTGIPRFDPLLDLRRRLPSSREARPGVLVALQSLGAGYNQRFLRTVLGAVAGLGVDVTVKSHPRDTEADLACVRAVVGEFRDAVSVTLYEEGDVYDLMMDADVVVSTFSNVLIEAAFLDRVSVCVNLTNEPLPVPLVELGIAVGCNAADDVAATISDALFDETFRRETARRRKQYFDHNPHLLESSSARRVASVVERLATGDIATSRSAVVTEHGRHHT